MFSLADDLVMERTSLYRTLEPIIASGAVKVRNAETGRAKIAELTEEGLVTIGLVMPYWAKAQEQVLKDAGVDIESWHEMHQLLSTVAKLPT